MRWILLFLLIVVSVSAITFNNDKTLVLGDISNDSNVVCERSRQVGFCHLQKELPCCIDENYNGYCSNDEPLIGHGRNLKYLWPTHTFKPSFSHMLMFVTCEGLVVITGNEYEDFLKLNNCTAKGNFAYCCDKDSFSQVNNKDTVTTGPTVVVRKVIEPPKEIEKPDEPERFIDRITASVTVEDAEEDAEEETMLLVVNENRWKLVEKGIIHDLYTQKAIRTEKERCNNGGGKIFDFKNGKGSYFSDVKNWHEGERVFMFKKPSYDIVPVVSWC